MATSQPAQTRALRHPFSADPADQNPQCNTIVVHNPPVETANDAFMDLLKAQRGYLRSKLVFSTPGNVDYHAEFDDQNSALIAICGMWGKQPGNDVVEPLHVTFSKVPFADNAPVKASQSTPETAPQSTRDQATKSIPEKTSQPVPEQPSEPAMPHDVKSRMSTASSVVSVPHRPNTRSLDRAGVPSNSLFCANLPDRATKEGINAVFTNQAGFVGVNLVLKYSPERVHRICFVNFVDIATATEAILDLNGFKFHGSLRSIYLTYANPRPFHPDDNDVRQTGSIERSRANTDCDDISTNTVCSQFQQASPVNQQPAALHETAFGTDDCGDRTIFIRNFSSSAVRADVERLYGHLLGFVETRLLRRRQIPVCYVEFQDVTSAETAILATRGLQLYDRFIEPVISTARDKSKAIVPLSLNAHSEESNALNTICVKRIPPETTTLELKSLFERLPGYLRFKESRRCRKPICWVLFDDTLKASHALKHLNGYLLSTGLPEIFSRGLQAEYAESSRVFQHGRGDRSSGNMVHQRNVQDHVHAGRARSEEPSTVDVSFDDRFRNALEHTRTMHVPCNTVHVANLPKVATQLDLETIFARQPGFVEVHLMHHERGGYCHVVFRNEIDAGRAIKHINGYQLYPGFQGRLLLDFAERSWMSPKPRHADLNDNLPQLSSDEEDAQDAEDGWGCSRNTELTSFSNVDEEEFSDYHSAESPNEKADCGASSIREVPSQDDSADCGIEGPTQYQTSTKLSPLAEPFRQGAQCSALDLSKASGSPLLSSKGFRSPEAKANAFSTDWVSRKMVIRNPGPSRAKENRSASTPVVSGTDGKLVHSAEEVPSTALRVDSPAAAKDQAFDGSIAPASTISMGKEKEDLLALFSPPKPQTTSASSEPTSIFASNAESAAVSEAPSESNQTSVKSTQDLLELMPSLEAGELNVESSTNLSLRCVGVTLPESQAAIPTSKAEAVASNLPRCPTNFLDLPMEIRLHIYDLLFESAFVFVSDVDVFRTFATGEAPLPCSSPYSNGISRLVFPCVVPKSDSPTQPVSLIDYGQRPALPSDFLGRRMSCKSLPFQKKHSTKGLTRRSTNTGLLTTSRQVAREFSEFAHHRVALAFGSHKSLTKWLVAQDSPKVLRRAGSRKYGIPYASFSRLKPSPFILNSRAHIRNICLEIKDHPEPSDASMRVVRLNYYDNWRKACKMIASELVSLKEVGISVHVPTTLDRKPCQLSLESYWVKPLMEFAKSKSLNGASITLLTAHGIHGITVDTGTAFSEVLRRKMLGWTDADALAALAEFKARPHVSESTDRSCWEVVWASNGLLD